MSVPICRYLCDSEKFTGVNPHDRYFLLFLAFNAEEDGTFRHPATKLIAMLGGVSRGSFYKQVSRLEEMGYLTRQNGTLSLSARLVAYGDSEASPTATATVADSDKGCRQERLPSSPTPPLTPDKTNNNHEYSLDPPIIPPDKTNGTITCMGQNPNVTVVRPNYWEQRANRKPWREYIEERRQAYLASKPQYTKEQEAFLSVYPKAPGDPVAFILAWEDVIKQDVLPKELVNAAGIASNSPAFKENGGQYIPKPENWLAGKGWAQAVEPWRAKRKQQAMQEDANLPPPDLDFDPFCKDLQDVVAITSDMPVPFNVRDTSYWEPNEPELIRLRAVFAIKKWVTARNNKLARTKQPLIDAAREVLNFFLIQERTGEKPYIPSNRIAWLNTNVIRVSPEEILTPEQAICLARQDCVL